MGEITIHSIRYCSRSGFIFSAISGSSKQYRSFLGTSNKRRHDIDTWLFGQTDGHSRSDVIGGCHYERPLSIHSASMTFCVSRFSIRRNLLTDNDPTALPSTNQRYTNPPAKSSEYSLRQVSHRRGDYRWMKDFLVGNRHLYLMTTTLATSS